MALPAVGPYRLSARVSDRDGAYRVKGLQASLGDSNLTGDVSLDTGGKRPKVTASLTSSSLDLDAFTGGGEAEGKEKTEKSEKSGETEEKGEDAGKPAEAAGRRVFSAAPLPLDALAAADAEVKFRGGRVVAGGVTLESVAIDLALANGRLTLEPVSAELKGGALKGEATVEVRGKAAPTVKASLAADKVDVGALLRDMGVTEVLEAKADLGLNVQGQGRSMHELMAGLDGRLGVIMGEGRLDNEYVDLIGADLLQQVAPWAPKREDTNVKCFVTGWDVAEGTAKVRDFLFATERVTIGGKGEVTLGTEELDLLLTPRPKDASLLSLAVPIRVGGTLASPTARPDTASVAKGIAGAALGVAINPLGILVPFVSAGSGGNPCVEALEEARKAAGEKDVAPAQQKGVVEETLQGIGDTLKGLFGQ